MKLARIIKHIRSISVYLLYIGIGVGAMYLLYQVKGYMLQIDPAGVAGVVTRPVSGPAAATEFKIRGSIPYWDQTAAVASFTSHQDLFHSVSLFWYYLSDEGSLVKYKDAVPDRRLIQQARAKGMKVSVVVTNLPEEKGSTWDSGRVVKVISEPQLRTKHIEEIAQMVSDLGADGVTIDYEEVTGESRDEFSFFMRELAAALHQRGLFVGVALHPKTGESSDKLYRYQDWSALSTYADELYIMAYGEHWDEGSPGPIASTGWVKDIIDYARSERVPLHKFFLGIPLYGYDWGQDADKATGLTYQDVRRLMSRFDIASEWGDDTPAPFFSYESGGTQHEVWFENGPSAEEKIMLAREAGFGGITFWRLGGEDPEVWERVRKIIQATPSATPR